jgi:DNA-binding CsgD family transcriptional regulator
VANLEEGLSLGRQLADKFLVANFSIELGLTELGRGDLERAAVYLREGLSLWAGLGDPYGIFEGLWGLAQVAEASGEARRAGRLFGAADRLRETSEVHVMENEHPAFAEHLEVARSQVEGVGWGQAYEEGRAMTLEEAVSYALEKEDADPLTTSAPGEPSAGQALVVLSRREEEVAALVAQGMSNRQIAQELFLSERTIEVHVSKILRKLVLTSRTEIASWATEQRLIAPNS